MPESLFYVGAKAAIRNPQGLFLVLEFTTATHTYWDLPGGRIEDGESTEAALRREVTEETGLTDLHIERPLGMAISGVRKKLPDGRAVGIVFDTYLCSTSGGTLTLEHNAKATWASAKRVADLIRSHNWPASLVDLIAEL